MTGHDLVSPGIGLCHFQRPGTSTQRDEPESQLTDVVARLVAQDRKGADMDNALARITEIADRDVPDVEKVGPYLVAVLDTSVAYLIRRDTEEPGSLRREGFTEIADLLGR